MRVTVTSQKGGVGKTTLATNLAEHLGAHLVDADTQGDALRYAAKRGLQATSALTSKEVQAAVLAHDAVVVDCAPGMGEAALAAMAMADLLVIPTRTGDADLVALSRALRLVEERIRPHRPEIKVAVAIVGARDTGRTRGAEAALKAQAESAGFLWLGRLTGRVGVEEAYAAGKPLIAMGGSVAYEARQLLSSVEEVLGIASGASSASGASVH